MYKIGVIGDPDSITGFRTLGMQVFPAAGPEEAGAHFRRMAAEGYALIYITEQAAEGITGLMDEYGDRLLPAVVLIPSVKGVLGTAMKAIHTRIIKAVAADLLEDRK